MLFHGTQKKHLFISKFIEPKTKHPLLGFFSFSRFINKALRTEDVDVLYQFRFYIMDLSEQLELKFLQLKEKQKDILKLYRGLKLSYDEVANFQNSIGNLISTNGYLSTSSDYSVAYGFATKSAKREGVARALFEYQVDLNVVQKIVIADIQEYSLYPDEAEFVVDIGKIKHLLSIEIVIFLL